MNAWLVRLASVAVLLMGVGMLGPGIMAGSRWRRRCRMLGSVCAWAVVLLLILCGAGCASNQPKLLPVAPVPTLTGTVERAAVCIGVLSAKAPACGVNVLLCPGADVDASLTMNWAVEAGITNRVMLLSQSATREGVKAAIRRATAGFGPEDLLFISLSGHGGRVRDLNGDEASGWDSTWCLYDGPWLDDDVWTFVQEEVPPCRIEFLADTCFAEGSWRAWVPFWDTSRPVDMDACLRVRHRQVRAGVWGGSIVQYAACREAESALGNRLGGQWTTALDDARRGARTRREWFADAAGTVDGQTPTLSTHGPLASSMLDGEPLR